MQQLSAAVSFPFHGSMHVLAIDLLTCQSALRSISRHRVKAALQTHFPTSGPELGGTIPSGSRTVFPHRGTRCSRSSSCGSASLLGKESPRDAVASLHGATSAYVGDNSVLQKTLVLTKLFLQSRNEVKIGNGCRR